MLVPAIYYDNTFFKVGDIVTVKYNTHTVIENTTDRTITRESQYSKVTGRIAKIRNNKIMIDCSQNYYSDNIEINMCDIEFIKKPETQDNKVNVETEVKQ